MEKRPKLGEVLPGLVLYIISVYQPCNDSVIVKALKEAGGQEKLPQKKGAVAYVNSLEWLMGQSLIRKTREGEYIVTSAGLNFLGKQRLAFPRDKYRLYYLHKLTSGRSQ